MTEQRLRPGLNRDAVKLLAVVFMLLDHIAWFFLPFGSGTAQVFHFFGRITAPVMCYYLAQGVRYTKNVRRYLLRLLVFALLSQGPWMILHRDKDFSLNMLFTLFLCLLMLHIDSAVRAPGLRLCGMALCFAATYFCDWAFYAPAWCLIFYRCLDNVRKQRLLFCAVGLVYFAQAFFTRLDAGFSAQNAARLSLFTLGVFLALPLLAASSDKKGRLPGAKWFFYVFYPLHLGVLAIIHVIINP